MFSANILSEVDVMSFGLQHYFPVKIVTTVMVMGMMM